MPQKIGAPAARAKKIAGSPFVRNVPERRYQARRS
jgi:hypothetical protein